MAQRFGILQPNNALYYAHRAMALSADKQLERSIEDLNEALNLEPQNPNFYNVRGVAFFQNEMMEQALKDFTEAIRLDPKNPLPYTNRGRVYKRPKVFLKNR